MSFLEEIEAKAKSNLKKIILPETDDQRVILAAQKLIEEKLCEVHLVTSKSDFNLKGAIIHNLADEKLVKKLQESYYELRKAKGISWIEAKRSLENPLVFGSMLLKENIVDGMVAGSIASTADVLRTGIQIIKPKKGLKTISSYFIMLSPDKSFGENGLMFFADCGVVPNPSSEGLADIALATAESFEKLTAKSPKIAMLSFSTKGSAKHADVTKVTQALELARPRLKANWLIDGELQVDAAIIPEIANKKAKDSPLSGQANILIFPDLDAGNMGYKLVQRFGKALAFGPMIQGLAKPINDLSRGCSIDDIKNVATLTAVLS